MHNAFAKSNRMRCYAMRCNGRLRYPFHPSGSDERSVRPAEGSFLLLHLRGSVVLHGLYHRCWLLVLGNGLRWRRLLCVHHWWLMVVFDHPPGCSGLLLGLGLLFFFLLLFLDDGCGVRITNLALDADKVGNVSCGVSEGGNEELVPKGRPVDAVVEQTHAEVGSLFDGVPDALDGLGVRFGPLQKPAVTPEDLVQRVSGEIQKALGGVNDGVVREGRVRDHKVLLGRL
mmetsp:Transcript_23457/g.65119  ORF Transcript_23457/g.65119 Transcript_23457/m.65119 type:complete len:229 (-) Transcript_23457:1142-1828(-)